MGKFPHKRPIFTNPKLLLEDLRKLSPQSKHLPTRSLVKWLQFTTLTKDRTKTLESKVQQTLPKIKSKFTEQDYRELHPTGTCPAKFYGTANIRKIPVTGNIDDFSITPIVSNINTATYNLAKYLLKLLAP